MGRSWSDLGPAWAYRGPSGGHLGAISVLLGVHFWVILGPCGASWNHFGVPQEPSWAILGLLQAKMQSKTQNIDFSLMFLMILNTCFSHLGTILDHLGTTWSAILGPSWTILGPFQASWRHLGTILARRGDILSRLGPIWMNFPRRNLSKYCVCARARAIPSHARICANSYIKRNTELKTLRVRTCAGVCDAHAFSEIVLKHTKKYLRILRVRTCARISVERARLHEQQ